MSNRVGGSGIIPAFIVLRRWAETMPFKSQAQRRKFAQLLVEGKISPDTLEEWNRLEADRLEELSADNAADYWRDDRNPGVAPV